MLRGGALGGPRWRNAGRRSKMTSALGRDPAERGPATRLSVMPGASLRQRDVAVALEVLRVPLAAGLRVAVAQRGLAGQLLHPLLGDLLEFLAVALRHVRHETPPLVCSCVRRGDYPPGRRFTRREAGHPSSPWTGSGE